MPHWKPLQHSPSPGRWIKLALSIAVLTLVGCGGKESILPQDGDTMQQVYVRHAGRQGQADLLDARSRLRRPLSDVDAEQAQYFLSDQSSEPVQYRRLANPDLVMYVFPHRATASDVPIPGYTTVFPLYEQIFYALPGEPVE